MVPEKSKSILILYISIGSGHRMAAEALEKSFKKASCDSKVVLFDLLNLWRPWVIKIGTWLYRLCLQIHPGLYDSRSAKNKLTGLQKWFCRKNRQAISELISELSPQVIICTQALPALLVADHKKVNGSSVKLVAVPTDFVVHDYWLGPEIDLYVLPVEQARTELLARGMDSSRLSVTGIPVDEIFSRNLRKKQIKKQYGFSADKEVVMLMGGGEGRASLPLLTQTLLESGGRYQLCVLAGKNLRILRKLRQLEVAAKDRLKVFGFIESVDELMGISDIIITKPGGLTVSEALVKGVPLVLVDPIPGQEMINADFLVQAGAAIRCKGSIRVDHTVNSLLKNKNKLRKMAGCARSLACPQAAQHAVSKILALNDDNVSAF